MESDRLHVHAVVAQPRVPVLYAKCFQERDANLPDTDGRVGILRELYLALHLHAFRLPGTQVGHLATVVPGRQFAAPERVVQLKNIKAHTHDIRRCINTTQFTPVRSIT